MQGRKQGGHVPNIDCSTEECLLLLGGGIPRKERQPPTAAYRRLRRFDVNRVKPVVSQERKTQPFRVSMSREAVPDSGLIGKAPSPGGTKSVS
jgi:hypothetical protein